LWAGELTGQAGVRAGAQGEADRIVRELAELEQQLRDASSPTRASAPALAAAPASALPPTAVFEPQRAAWSQLVRKCALSSGRKESNLRVYLGPAVLNRQLAALGPAALADILQLTARATAAAPTLSVGDRERVSALLRTARGQLDEKDSGSKAALSAVDQTYGRRTPPLAAAACPAAAAAEAVAIKREVTGAGATGVQKRVADVKVEAADGPSAGKRRCVTGLGAASASAGER